MIGIVLSDNGDEKVKNEKPVTQARWEVVRSLAKYFCQEHSA